MNTVQSWPVEYQVLFGSVTSFPFIWTQLFYSDTCIQSAVAMMVDIFDHMNQYLTLTEWAYILFADVNLVFNMNRLRTCWEPETTILGSVYTDQNNTTEYAEYEWYTAEVMEFVQMDLFNSLRLVEYTDLTLESLIQSDWVYVGINGM